MTLGTFEEEGSEDWTDVHEDMGRGRGQSRAAGEHPRESSLGREPE